jgi:2,3-diketo-5-methylthio-1-phosphopentane phosphatase
MLKYVVLSDFDGTISEDLSTIIYSKFADVGMKYADLWSQGKLSTPEEIMMTFETIHASQSEIAQAVHQAEIDVGFPEFVRLCMKNNLEVAVISDGIEWAIRTVLEHNGVPEIQVFANQIHFIEGGFQFSFPWHHERCPHAGVCKPEIIDNFHKKGQRVIYIGDGRSDYQAIHEADIIYAKDQLLAYCQQHNVSAVPFQNFNNLINAINKGDFPYSIG